MDYNPWGHKELDMTEASEHTCMWYLSRFHTLDMKYLKKSSLLSGTLSLSGKSHIIHRYKIHQMVKVIQ